MNEQTMIWFLQKSIQHQLSRDAMLLWMDFYAHLQNQTRACYPQIGFAQLQQFCDLKRELRWAACKELEQAGMLELTVRDQQLYCRLIAEQLYKNVG